MHDFKQFKIICLKCQSPSTEVNATRGGCDSCGNGEDINITCNNCHNIEAIP